MGSWNISIPYIFVVELFEINKAHEVFGTTIGILITLAKTYLFLFIPITMRWTLHRLRIDQLLNMEWKFLLPIFLSNLLLTTCLKLNSMYLCKGILYIFMACLKQEKETNIKIFINIYVMFPMVTRVMDYGQQTVRVARYIGQGFIDYHIPCKSFTCNYSISL